MKTSPSSEKCTSKAKRTGERCTKWPVKGATVCPSHGGRAPQVKAKAALRLAERDAAVAVSKFGVIEPVTNPLEVLGSLAGELVAVKDFLRGKVEQIEQIRTLDDKSGEQLRAEFAAYMSMLNACVAGLVSIGKLNIDERLARVTERQAEALMTAMKHGFAAAGVTGEPLNEGMRAVGRHLRAIAGGKA